MVRKKSMNTVASRRGATSLRIGSVPSARIASSCSVTFIEPISEAMPAALRPDTIRPVSTGPSSFTIDSETSEPVMETAPKLAVRWQTAAPARIP